MDKICHLHLIDKVKLVNFLFYFIDVNSFLIQTTYLNLFCYKNMVFIWVCSLKIVLISNVFNPMNILFWISINIKELGGTLSPYTQNYYSCHSLKIGYYLIRYIFLICTGSSFWFKCFDWLFWFNQSLSFFKIIFNKILSFKEQIMHNYAKKKIILSIIKKGNPLKIIFKDFVV